MNNLITTKKNTELENPAKKKKLTIKRLTMVDEMFSVNQDEGNSSV